MTKHKETLGDTYPESRTETDFGTVVCAKVTGGYEVTLLRPEGTEEFLCASRDPHHAHFYYAGLIAGIVRGLPNPRPEEKP